MQPPSFLRSFRRCTLLQPLLVMIYDSHIQLALAHLPQQRVLGRSACNMHMLDKCS
jgi:hypothetical protein